MIRVAVCTPRSVSWQEKAQFQRLCEGGGGVPPIATERVRKRLKTRGLRRSIAQKSPETI
jgi:hypothetical protein